MAAIQLHSELAALSQQNPAGYIVTESLARIALRRLLDTVTLLKGKTIVAGSGELSATLRDVQWAKAPEASLVPPKNPAFPDREVDIGVSPGFDIIVDIFITKTPADMISTVTLQITDTRIHMRAENNILILEGTDFDFKRSIVRTADADQLLTNAGIDLLEAARVEGHIGYGVVTQSVASALGQRIDTALSTVFPAVDFGTSIKLEILLKGAALGIIPTEEVTIVSTAHCECSEGPDLGVGETTIKNTAPANPKPNDELAQVQIGGPIPDNKDPLKDFGNRPGEQKGVAGLYIPQAFARALTVSVMPAIKIKASDNGTIGYRAEASVGFSNFQVSFDQKGGGILLDIDLDISVSAYCDFELFKGVRIPIGWAIISPAQGSQANVQLGFYPAVDNSGTVRLKSTLKKSNMGSYVAVVIGIGTALEIIGVTAWIGFLIDVVLSSILSQGLPIALKKEIGKHLANKEWKLIDGFPTADQFQKPWFLSAPYDVTADSLLSSFEYRG